MRVAARLTSLIAASLALAGSSRAVEVPPGFVAETLAANLNMVTAMAPAPDGRIFIADQTGPLLVWKDGRVLERPALDLSARLDTYWERGMIGIALHPRFPDAPQVFVLYVAKAPHTHHVLSVFTISGDVLEAASEKILLEGDDQAKLGGTVSAGHQGGPLRFGADGCLYVSLGEQTAGEPAQRLDTLQGKILRIRPDGSVPDDNPFIAQTSGKYRAIFARGVRNSFGIAVQPGTARIFFTDVGGSAFEEINELAAGANYGWPLVEGLTKHAEFKQPLYAYSPVIGSSIVGGAFVPAADEAGAWPAKWRGKLLVADFMKHWVKALDPDAPEKLVSFAGGLNGPVALEFAADGSLLVLNRGTIWRDPKKVVPNAGSLVRIRYTGAAAAPATSGNGALGLPLAAAQLPARITAADWDQRVSAARARSVTLRNHEWHAAFTATTRAYFPDIGRVTLGDGELDFPQGTVFVREFAQRDGSLVERRVQMSGNPNGWAASYRVAENGDASLQPDGEVATLAGSTWFFPPMETQIRRPIISLMYWLPLTIAEWNTANERESPLAALQRLGLLDGALPAALPAAADWRNSGALLEARVRTYLHAHCAVCHQPGGPSRGLFDARLTTPLDKTRLIRGALAAGDLGIAGAQVVVPGAPDKSILLRRIRETSFFRMPPVQFHNEPSPIIPVLEQWIRSLK